MKTKTFTYEHIVQGYIDSTSYVYTNQINLSESILHLTLIKTKKGEPLQISNNNIIQEYSKSDKTSYIYTNNFKNVYINDNPVSTGKATIVTEPPKLATRGTFDGTISNLMLSIFFIGLLIIALSKIYYKGYINNMLYSIINYRRSSNLLREFRKNPKRISKYFSLNYILTTSTFLTSSIIYFEILPLVNIPLFTLLTAILIFLFYLLHKLANTLISGLFSMQSLGKEYNFTLKIFNQSLGVILTPLILLIGFTDYPEIAIGFGIFAFVSILILRVIRFVKINFQNNVNIFYLFLYLCTLEIIPVLLVLKIINLLINKGL